MDDLSQDNQVSGSNSATNMAPAPQQPMDTKSKGPSGGNTMKILIAVIVLGGLGLYLYSTLSYNLSTNSSASRSSGLVSGVIGYFTQQESASLMGAGGSYSAQNSTNTTQIDSLLTTQGLTVSQITTYGITTAAAAFYTDQNKTLLEEAFLTPNAKTLYHDLIAMRKYTFPVSNATANGLIYSYLGPTGGTNFAELLGWKNSEFVVVVVANANVSSSQLATTASGDIS